MKVRKKTFKESRVSSCILKGTFGGTLLLSSLLIFGACESDFEEYYETPGWIDSNAYDVLANQGRFVNYLKLVDKTLFSTQLKGSGSYTFFAPNDAAFASWLSEKGYASVDDVPADVASEIVSYTMVYNQYESGHLGDIWEGATWEGNKGSSFRKMTPSYKTLYQELRPGDTSPVYVYDEYKPPFNPDYFDHRFLHIYTGAYFNANKLGQTDYERVYAGASYNSVGNVHGAQIVNPDIYASNGVVHELDRVVEVPKNLDEMIVEYGDESNVERQGQGWKVMKELLYNKLGDGSYQFLSYEENDEAATYFQRRYPEKEAELSTVYARSYDLGELLFSPSINDYATAVDASERTESNAYTLFLPNEEAFRKYINDEVLLYTKNKSFNELSADVIQTVIRSHVSRSMVWPSQFASAKNLARDVNGEFINGIGSMGDKYEDFGVSEGLTEVATNALVYHIDHPIESGLFKSVYGRVLLDPSYSHTLQYLSGTSIYTTLTGNTPFANGLKTANYTGKDERYQYALLLSADELLEADGLTFDNLTNTFGNDKLVEGAAVSGTERISRLIQNGFFIREISPEDEAYPTPLDFSTQPEALAGEYDGWGFAVNYYGELVRYKNNQLQAIGNIEDGTFVTVTVDDKSYVNGVVYETDGLLNYSPRDSKPGEVAGWQQSERIQDDVTAYLNKHSDCSIFKKYWTNANLTALIEARLSTSAFYTVLIPTDERMQEAIDLGCLPTESELAEKAADAANFILDHFLEGGVYADDGLDRVYESNAHYTTSYSNTAARVEALDYGVLNAKVSIAITKDKNDGNRLTFLPRDLMSGQTLVFKGTCSQQGTNSVIRGIENSNVPARLSVIHKFDGFLCHLLNAVVSDEEVESEN